MGQEPASNNHVVMMCRHCGNKTVMHQVADFKYQGSEDVAWDDYGNPIFSISWSDYYALHFCPVCSNVTLRKTSFFSEDRDETGKIIPTEEVLYPTLKWESRNMPKNVSAAFESAIKVRHIDGAICALSLRRTLEMMCRDRGATTGNLYSKLQQLSREGILPPIVENMASVLKNVGNAAAHADDAEFPLELVEAMINFTQTVLDYVYHLPQALEDIQKRLTKPEKSTQDN